MNLSPYLLRKLVLILGVFIVLGAILSFIITRTTQPKASIQDPDVISIIEEFARKKVSHVYSLQPEAKQELEALLLQCLKSVGKAEESRLDSLRKILKSDEIILEDAPDGRSFALAWRKFDVSESLILNDLKGTVSRCGSQDLRPQEISWQGGSLGTAVDDITADIQVLPYFLTGLGCLHEGDNAAAKYYLRQIINHLEAGSNEWIYGGRADFMRVTGSVYRRIIAKTEQLLANLE